MTTTATPHEPVIPDILVGDTGKPLRCERCGGELELRCGEGHKHAKKVGAMPALRGKPRTYKPKACIKCHGSFTPTGPRADVCQQCRSVQ